MKMVSSIPERLRELVGDMSLSEFARQLGGTSKQSVSAYLKGERTPKTAFINKAAEVCGVQVAWLLGYDVPRCPPAEPEAEDQDIVLLNRAAQKMSPQQRRQLIDMAKVVFRDAFEDG